MLVLVVVQSSGLHFLLPTQWLAAIAIQYLLLITRFVQELCLVLIVNRAEELVVECLLWLPLSVIFRRFLSTNVPLLQIARRIGIISDSKDIGAQTVGSPWTITRLIIIKCLIIHLLLRQIILRRLRSLRILRNQRAAVRILNRRPSFDWLAGRQGLLDALRAEVEALLMITQRHRHRHLLLILIATAGVLSFVKPRHHTNLMIQIPIRRYLILLPNVFLNRICIHLAFILEWTAWAYLRWALHHRLHIIRCQLTK